MLFVVVVVAVVDSGLEEQETMMMPKRSGRITRAEPLTREKGLGLM